MKETRWAKRTTESFPLDNKRNVGRQIGLKERFGTFWTLDTQIHIILNREVTV